MDYHWPGNVRELENVIERELILYTGGSLTFEGFIMTSTSRRPVEMLSDDEQLLPFDDASKAYIQHALKITDGQIGGPKGAADKLGLRPSTLRNKMIRLGIPFKRATQ